MSRQTSAGRFRGPHRTEAIPGAEGLTSLWGAAFLFTLLSFWPSVKSLADVWSTRGFSHGWAIAALTLWMVWRDRWRLLAAGGAFGPALVLPIIGLSCVWLAAVVANVRVIHVAVFALLLSLWPIGALGSRAAKIVVPIAGTFLLAVPVWDTLVVLLRPMTVVATGSMATLLRIPVAIDGDLITIESGQFLVADGCAGLQYLMAGLTLGVVYAQLMLRRGTTRLLVIALAAAIAIVGNWIRVTVLVVVGHVSRMQSSLIEDHLWQGWVIFNVGMIAFFLLAGHIRVRDSRHEREPLPTPRDVQLPTEGTRTRDSRRQVITATLLTIVGPLTYLGVGMIPSLPTPDFEPTSLASGNAWSVVDTAGGRISSWSPGYQRADAHRTITFANGSRQVNVDWLVYRSQEQGAELIGYPNAIAPASAVMSEAVAAIPVSGGRAKWLRQAIVTTPEAPLLVWYWYRIGEIETFSGFRAKMLEVVAFLRRRPSAELIALSASCAPDSCQGARTTLQSFLAGR